MEQGIGAETEAQRRQAFRQMKGLLGDHAESWRKRLTEALALAEAAIDFPDEGIEADDVFRAALAIAQELERERARGKAVKEAVKDPEMVRTLEGLKLARTELQRQREATTHEQRRAQIGQAIAELDRRMTEIDARIGR